MSPASQHSTACARRSPVPAGHLVDAGGRRRAAHAPGGQRGGAACGGGGGGRGRRGAAQAGGVAAHEHGWASRRLRARGAARPRPHAPLAARAPWQAAARLPACCPHQLSRPPVVPPQACAARCPRHSMHASHGLPPTSPLSLSLHRAADVRRAVFCAVMGSEDCVDAVEKLLRLGLRGEQERELVRVTLECCLQARAWCCWRGGCRMGGGGGAGGCAAPHWHHCPFCRALQERAWNPYYAHLLLRLCGAGKNHKMTLQVRRGGRRMRRSTAPRVARDARVWQGHLCSLAAGGAGRPTCLRPSTTPHPPRRSACGTSPRHRRACWLPVTRPTAAEATPSHPTHAPPLPRSSACGTS